MRQTISYLLLITCLLFTFSCKTQFVQKSYEIENVSVSEEVGTMDSTIVKLYAPYKNICEKEKPDIILLGIPLGILPLNDYVQNEYGTIMFKITNAIRIDFLILSLYYEEYYNEKYIDEMQNFLK